MQLVRRILGDLFWLVVAGAIVAAGFVGFRQLGEAAPVVAPAPVERPVPSVETVALAASTAPIPIRGTGFVAPFRVLSVSAEQSGRIVELHPALDTNGSFAEGDVLVRLDDSSARAALAQAEANLAATQARLDLTRTQLTRTQSLRERGVVAQEALDLLLFQENELSGSLQSQAAARESALIALDNTTIEAPFTGTVQAKHAEVGTVVMAGQAIADIYTSDALEVTVALREAAAALVPGLFDGVAAPAEVTLRFAGQPVSWAAEVARVDPELDPASRALDVTVRLTGRGQTEGGAPASGVPPALINSFAHVVIDGATPEHLYALPSTAVHGTGTEVRLAVEDRLVVHPARLVHVDGDESFVVLADVPTGARLIVSPLDVVVDGMAISDLSTAAEELAHLQE